MVLPQANDGRMFVLGLDPFGELYIGESGGDSGRDPVEPCVRLKDPPPPEEDKAPRPPPLAAAAPAAAPAAVAAAVEAMPGPPPPLLPNIDAAPPPPPPETFMSSIIRLACSSSSAQAKRPEDKQSSGRLVWFRQKNTCANMRCLFLPPRVAGEYPVAVQRRTRHDKTDTPHCVVAWTLQHIGEPVPRIDDSSKSQRRTCRLCSFSMSFRLFDCKNRSRLGGNWPDAFSCFP